MASTRNLTRPGRKHAKRVARRRLKALRAGMTREERKAFRKEEKLTLKVFLARRRAAAEKARAAAEKAAAGSQPVDRPVEQAQEG